MPTTTFFNLPEEKRTRIIHAALQEFAAYSFDQSSIARIIEKAEIPRGSFYQYFKNLKDLYVYILNLAGEQKLTYFRRQVPQFEGEGFDFFQTLHDLCMASFQFAEENPELLAIGNNFLKETNQALRQEIMAEQLPKAQSLYSQMLQRGMERGQIEPRIDPLAATFFLSAWSNSLTEYYLAELNHCAPDEAKDGCSFLKDPKFLDRMNQMLDLLAHGLAPRSTSPVNK